MNERNQHPLDPLSEQGRRPDLTPEQRASLDRDRRGTVAQILAAEEGKGLYDHTDEFFFPNAGVPTMNIQTLDELLERDKQRAADGFPKKVILGKIASQGGKKAVIVPSVTEEKFYHDTRPKMPGQGGDEGGSGEGEEGEVIGESPIKEEQQGGGQGAGDQSGGEGHELDDSRALEIGKALTEKFNLPNIQQKGKKTALFRYTYELTDINRKFGQFLDKKRSLKNIIKTNLLLGTFTPDDVKFDKIVVSPVDLVYRIVSPEKEYESQAMVFFLRDYSGSMYGDPTEVVLSQHVLIYSWLLYQYQERVEKRFILHDTDAREVDNFVSYYRLNNGGGTNIASAYKLVNKIVETEDLAKDYNIYIFQGTDGDDWDSDGKEALPEIEKMLTYVNRMGITVVSRTPGQMNTQIEKYLDKSGLLKKSPHLLKMTALGETARNQDEMIKSIRDLVE